VSYNMWFVTPAAVTSPANEWLEFIAEFGDGLRGELTDGTPDDWRLIQVFDSEGDWAFDFERTLEGDAEAWDDHRRFFTSWLGVAEPRVNVQWIAQYFLQIKTIYMFRCSNGSDSALELVREIIDSLQNDDESGLMYAELEGWSNEDGYHITWGFTESVTGPWWMAVRAGDGWDTFQMELGNSEHRSAFKAGTVPPGLVAQHRSD